MIWSVLRSDTAVMDRIESRLPGRINDTLTNFAREIIADVDRSFYTGQAPSPVGGPPAIVTGELRDSAEVAPVRGVDGRFTFGKTIRYNAAYASILETDTYNPGSYQYNRPFLEAALSRAEGRFNMIWEGILRP